jgi:tetratricopeptide (TPR) repeat protein
MIDYSTKEVATLLDLAEARLRYWAQTGVVGPSKKRAGKAVYDFVDLVAVKVTKALLDHGLSLQAVRKNLEALRRALPDLEQPFAELKVITDGERLVVIRDGEAFEPLTGQVVMALALAELSQAAATITPIAPPQALARIAAPPPPPPATALGAFTRALAQHDKADFAGAERSYRQAVELDPNLAAGWSNLAVLCERRGAADEARAAAERAVLLDPEQPEARYNLAALLADLGERELARAQLERVLDLAPGFGDALYNLAMLVGKEEPARARQCLEQYLALDASTGWATHARQLLAAL